MGNSGIPGWSWGTCMPSVGCGESAGLFSVSMHPHSLLYSSLSWMKVLSFSKAQVALGRNRAHGPQESCFPYSPFLSFSSFPSFPSSYQNLEKCGLLSFFCQQKSSTNSRNKALTEVPETPGSLHGSLYFHHPSTLWARG